MFFMGGIDSWRMIVNSDYIPCRWCPEKKYPRSETVDFQRGEVEWEGGSLYFPQSELSHGYRLSELLSSFFHKRLKAVFRKDLSVSQKTLVFRETFSLFLSSKSLCVMQQILICQSLPLTAVKLHFTVKREQSDKENNRMIFVVILTS